MIASHAILGFGLVFILTGHILSVAEGYSPWKNDVVSHGPDWLRCITFAALGYEVARYKNLKMVVLISLTAALIDSAIPLAVQIVGVLKFASWQFVVDGWQVTLLHMLGDVAAWSFCAVMGAMLLRMPWKRRIKLGNENIRPSQPN